MNRNLKKCAAGLSVCLLLVAVAMPALARDMGPQRVTATLTDGVGTIAPPTGDTGRFYPSHIIFDCAAGETQTVAYVVSGVTNTYGTKVVAAGDAVLALTNVPPMFSGDYFLVTGSDLTVTNSATLVGTLFD